MSSGLSNLKLYIKNPETSDRVRNDAPSQVIFEFAPYLETEIDNLTKTHEHRLPRCQFCGAYANCYNKYDGSNMECCICHKKCQIHALNRLTLEYFKPIYFAESNYLSNNNQTFAPTEYFITSLSLLSSKFLNTLVSITNRSSTFKQYGFAIFHGSISFLETVSGTSITTVSYDLPKIDTSKIFCSSIIFQDHIKKISTILPQIKKNPSRSANFIFDYIKKLSNAKTNVIHIFLDEIDFQSLQNEYNYHLITNELIKNGTRVSIYVVSNPLSSPHSLFEIPISTGGDFKIINPTEIDNIIDIVRPFIDQDVVYNSFISIKTNGTLNGIEGHGFTHGRGTHNCGTIKYGEKFYFDCLIPEFYNEYVQFNVLFTSILSFSRLCVITVHNSQIQFSVDVFSNYLNSTIFHEMTQLAEFSARLSEIKKNWDIKDDRTEDIKNSLLALYFGIEKSSETIL